MCKLTSVCVRKRNFTFISGLLPRIPPRGHRGRSGTDDRYRTRGGIGQETGRCMYYGTVGAPRRAKTLSRDTPLDFSLDELT